MRQWIKLFEDSGQLPTASVAQKPGISQPLAQKSTTQIATPQEKQVPQNTVQADPDDVALLKQVLKQDYPRFVTLLGKHVRDPKFVAAIKQLSTLDKVDLQEMPVPAANLMPTQNEIDITKSLSYALKDPNSVSKYLQGGPVSVNGPIVTSGGGAYIVDGHHRWSQVYLFNPWCSIESLDMTDIKGPFDALKATQLGIAAATSKVPTQKVEGSNLMTISDRDFVNYVVQNIDDGVLDVLRQFKKIQSPSNDKNARLQAANFLWQNVKYMRKNNRPIQGAPSRGLMPQTDTAKGQWDDNAPNPETVTEVELIKKLAGIGGS